MADNFYTVGDLARINDMNLSDAEVNDLRNEAPLLARLAADTASNGLMHKYLKESGAPDVGFRDPNSGRENEKSADTMVEVALKLLDCSYAVDKSIADNYRRGAEAWIAREGRRHLAQGLFELEEQIWYGTNTDAAGFMGLSQDSGLDHADDELVIDAGGTADGNATSVWAIRTNDLGTDCQLIMGNEGQLEMGQSIEQAITDPNGGRFPGYFTPLQGHFTLQVGSRWSVGRIVNLTEEDGRGLTDDLISKLFGRFPARRRPNLLVMTPRSQEQLRSSRTTFNPTGQPAPFPEMAFNVPIVPTDSIRNDEALVPAANAA